MGACRACCQKTTLQAATYPGSNERSCQIQRLENKGREKHTGNFGKRAKLKNYHPCQPKCQKATSNFHIKQFATKTDFATNSKLTNFQFSSKKTVCPARRRRVWLPSPLSCHKPSPFCLCPHCQKMSIPRQGNDPLRSIADGFQDDKVLEIHKKYKS